jgi:enoyl-CoA hydratase
VVRHGAVAVATFARPPRNLMSFVAMGELESVLTELSRDDAVNVVVITGGVPGYFIAHADLNDLTAIATGGAIEGDPGAWNRTLRLIEEMPQPVIAAINGQAWGGGCELSLACTLRVASQSAHLGQPEVNVGIIPGAGGTQRLPRLIGAGAALDLILSGRIVDADEALRLGLVQAVLPDDRFIDHVLEWAAPMARQPKFAMAAAKRAVVEGLRMPFADALRLEGQLFIECQMSPAAVELEREALQRYAAAADDDQVTL